MGMQLAPPEKKEIRRVKKQTFSQWHMEWLGEGRAVKLRRQKLFREGRARTSMRKQQLREGRAVDIESQEKSIIPSVSIGGRDAVPQFCLYRRTAS